MKNLLLSLVLFSLVACSGDDNQTNNNPIGLSGNQFDMLIDGSPIDASLDKAIVDENGIPYVNTNHWTDEWFQGGALINVNTRVGVRLMSTVSHLTVGIYQHQQYVTVNQPRLVYQLNFTDFQQQDYVEFTIGQNGQLNGFKIYRYYNGGSLNNLDQNVQIYTGTITQL